MSATHSCPDWCTAGTDEHPCDGSHMRIDWDTGRVASGSNFPTIDERGAVFPAIAAGLSATPSEGRGPQVFLFMRGPGCGDGEEIAFPLDEAFGLAVDILDMYSRAIQEIDHPAAPWPDWQTLRPIVEIIEHCWGRESSRVSIDAQIADLKINLQATDPMTEQEAYSLMFGQLVALERRRRDLLEMEALG